MNVELTHWYTVRRGTMIAILLLGLTVNTVLGLGVVVTSKRSASPPRPLPVGAGGTSSSTVRSITADHVALTSELRPFRTTMRLDTASGKTLDTATVTCHGGLADVSWVVGDLEPTRPETGISVAITMDGKAIGGVMKGSTRGVWDDGSATAKAVVPCPQGRHVFSAVITSISGEWGIPYVVDPGRPPATNIVVDRGLIIREYWR